MRGMSREIWLLIAGIGLLGGDNYSVERLADMGFWTEEELEGMKPHGGTATNTTKKKDSLFNLHCYS